MPPLGYQPQLCYWNGYAWQPVATVSTWTVTVSRDDLATTTTSYEFVAAEPQAPEEKQE